ncbi:MAG: sodium:solute symporter, partial [Verrucomicrobiales bacterium]
MKTPCFHSLDWIILLLYFGGTMGIGLYFYRRTRSTEGYTAANRSLPGWVCGLSIFATFLSSISYLALPGKSFASNWNPFVFSLSIPIVTWIAVRWFLPYYRASGEISAYALLEKRFGLWARIYASLFYLLTQIARIAVVLYLMALPMQVIFGWSIYTILIVTGVCVTFYAFVGGILAVIWTDAIQAIVLMVGAVLCLAIMLANVPGGASEVIRVAAEHEKFSLGEFGFSLTAPTFWVVLVYGIAINLQNFGIDQSYVQRYIASRSDAEARKGLWLGGLLYVPVSALFFFIGTTLFVSYGAGSDDPSPDLASVKEIVARQQVLQDGLSPASPEFDSRTAEIATSLELADVGDRVFPHFIATHLPPGITGLLIAAVFAAARVLDLVSIALP